MSRIRVPAFALVVLALAPEVIAQTGATPGEWRTFEGTLSATGTRQTLPTESGSPAAIVQVSGAIALTRGAGLSRGFRGEAIFFFDGVSVGVGRAVWTDDHGDRIFSTLKGEVVETGRRVAGTITGGTGRYASLTGDYAFSWQVVVETEEGVLQGRTVELEGRVRRGEDPR